MIGYTLDNFITHSYDDIIVDHDKINNFNFFLKGNNVLKENNY
jgi:hypothetical protein